MHGEDGVAGGLVGGPDVEDLVEAAGAHEGRVHGLGAVGGGEDEDAGEGLEAVHLGEERGEHVDGAGGSVRSWPGALAADGVDLVKEDDGRGSAAGSLEQRADGALRLADVHVEELGALDGEEVEAGLGGHGLRGEGLGTSWGAVEEEAFGRVGEDAACCGVGALYGC